MPDTIRAELRKLLTAAAAEAASVRLHAPVRVLARTFQSAIPVVLDALAGCANDPARLDAVSSLVIGAGADTAIEDLPATIAGGEGSSLWTAAQQLLDIALPQRAGPTAGHLAKATGVPTAAAAGVLTVTAVMAMGVIARRIGTGPLGVSRLAEILASANARPSIVSTLQRPLGLRPATPTTASGSQAVQRMTARLLPGPQSAPPARGAVVWLGIVVLAGAGLFIWPDSLVDIRSILVAPSTDQPDRIAVRSPAPPPTPAATPSNAAPPPATSAPAAQPALTERRPATPRFEPAPAATEQPAARIEVATPAWPAAADLPLQALPPLPPPRVDTTAMRDDVPAVPPIGISPARPPATPDALPAQGIESRLIGFIEDPSAPLDSTTWFDLEGVTFRTASTALSPGSRAQIGILAEILTLFPSVRLTVAGHTDNQGDPGDNINLSAGRAQSVAAALQQRGIDPQRLTVLGLGAQRPIADNATAAGRARNRRIAVQVTAR